MTLGRDLWGPFAPRMILEVLTLLLLWPGVEDPGLCAVIGGKSETGRRQSWTGSQGKKKEERNSSSSSPAARDLHTSGNPSLRFPLPFQQNPEVP